MSASAMVAHVAGHGLREPLPGRVVDDRHVGRPLNALVLHE
jgi:hypothetical protein